MLSGFNTNVRHRGLLLHVQTEDSGRRRPHVITHLYCGGTILASERSDYEDRLGSEDLAGDVKRLMEEQHRTMLRRVRRGEFDARMAERLGRDVFSAEATAREPAEAPAAPADAPATAEGRGRAPDERRLDEIVAEYLEQRARGRRRP